MERAFKGIWIPKEIWLDKTLGWSEKLLLVEIESLDNEQGCFASNEYFAEFFNLSKDRISRMISSLKNKGYVTVDLVYKEGTKQIEKRVIRVTDEHRRKHREGIGENANRYGRKQQGGIGENNDTPIGENAKDNNTSINNTVNNTKEYTPYVEIVNYLNGAANTSYRSSTKKTQQLIKARFKDGFTLDDFKRVIDIKTAEWLNDQNMNRFLRPETLFGTKFESYLNQKDVKVSIGAHSKQNKPYYPKEVNIDGSNPGGNTKEFGDVQLFR
ncbi:conserved phage C-terminal domain-containing protein [Metabacillus fastidiosus]|uniref:Conserved phage C-terminal domain-containing protein n=1 Tax=Metabacillus fastidiosus TaxID=1458 RepID=A0ABU6NRP1_9BACI|nr:conserved phage C-terminal domain-containing protein [Metabacillus fastidiosus]